MARLPRLAIADQAHLVLLRGHGRQGVFRDDIDRAAFLSALETACRFEGVALHAYAMLPGHVWLLCTPASVHAMGRAIQSVGRRFSVAFNRRHQLSGSVWDGRYSATVVEAGAPLLEAMLFVDQAPAREGLVQTAVLAEWSSAGQHVGLATKLTLTDAAAYWELGNTPFDRCAAYRVLLEEALPGRRAEYLAGATRRGWAIGSPAFVQGLRQLSARPVAPLPRGRPRKRVAA
jgi:REP-associated tyrosine transposase